MPPSNPRMLCLLFCLFASGEPALAQETSKGSEVVPAESDGPSDDNGAAYGLDMRMKLHVEDSANQSSERVYDADQGRADKGQGAFRVGTLINLCFTPKKDGYISVWDTDADGKVTRLYPNKHAYNDKRSVRVEGGKEVCLGDGAKLGDGTEPFNIRVTSPLGDSSITARLTQNAEDHPLESDYAPLVGPRSELMRTLGDVRQGIRPRATATRAEEAIVYRVVK